jgi:hypothetical protein
MERAAGTTGKRDWMNIDMMLDFCVAVWRSLLKKE